MYTRVVAWATSATLLPMWSAEGSGIVLLPNMVTDFRDKTSSQMGYPEQEASHIQGCPRETSK
jgi:hypothetical protein